jgi:ribosomal protein S25
MKKGKIYKFHYDIIEDKIDDGIVSLKTFALYLLLKTYHKNPVFYNTSINDIAKKVGISFGLAKKLIGQMEKEMLCSWHKSNLCLTSLRNIDKNPKRNSVYFAVRIDMTLTEVVDILRATLIHKDYSQQEFMRHLHSDRPKKLNRSQRTRAVKYLRCTKCAPELQGKAPFTSYRRIAKVQNISLSTTEKFIKRIEKSGIVKFRVKKKKIAENVLSFDYKANESIIGGFLYLDNGTLWLHQGQHILHTNLVSHSHI